jgi:hypothetical protein
MLPSLPVRLALVLAVSLCSGLIAGEEPVLVLRGAAAGGRDVEGVLAARAEGPSPRVLLEGVVTEVLPVPEPPTVGVAGFMRVEAPDGSSKYFRVFTYTLILIRAQGRLWAGRLDQVRPGWPASVAYDLPPDPSNEPPWDPYEDADNMIVDHLPEP